MKSMYSHLMSAYQAAAAEQSQSVAKPSTSDAQTQVERSVFTDLCKRCDNYHGPAEQHLSCLLDPAEYPETIGVLITATKDSLTYDSMMQLVELAKENDIMSSYLIHLAAEVLKTALFSHRHINDMRYGLVGTIKGKPKQIMLHVVRSGYVKRLIEKDPDERKLVIDNYHYVIQQRDVFVDPEYGEIDVKRQENDIAKDAKEFPPTLKILSQVKTVTK